MYCGQHTLVKYHGPAGDQSARILWCNAWSCPDCAERRKKRLMAEAGGGQPNTFVTLTIRENHPGTREQQARALADAWKRIQIRARAEARRDISRRPTPSGAAPADGWKTDKLGRTARQVTLPNGRLPFIAVFEATAAGTPHLHILCRSNWIGQEWLSLQTTDLINAPIVDIRRVRTKAMAAAYVAKYAGKNPTHFGTCKRYWKSTDYEVREKWKRRTPTPPYVTYSRWDRQLWSVAEWWAHNGWSIEWKTPSHIVARRPRAGERRPTGPPG